MKNKACGAKTVPKRNSCECLLFTGVIFLPAFDLFDLFSTFRITMILQLQTDSFHNFLSGFIIKLIERCKQIIYIRMISNYKQQVRELLFKVLNRRSGRKSYTREGFIEMLKYYLLALPKIYVSLF